MQEPTLSRRQLLDILDLIETKYPVDTWKANGIDIWPLIKIDIFFRHVAAENRDGGLSVKAEERNKQLKKINVTISALKSLLKYFLLMLKPKKEIEIFYSDSETHRVVHNGRFINRYFQPLIEHFDIQAPEADFCFINNDTKDRKKYPKSEPMLFVQDYVAGAKIYRMMFKREKSPISQNEGFKDFVAELTSQELSYLNLKSYFTLLNKRIKYILSLSDIVEVLIKKYNPKLIFELCYYSIVRLAINYAGNKHKVKTIEIQHGGMGRDHVSYSNWTRIPQEGFNLMPHTFWVWDDSSKKLIEKWIVKQQFHKVVNGGNPWHSYISGSDGNYKFPNDKKIILFTAQYVEIPKVIIDAIKATPDESFQWWIRLHPGKLGAKPSVEKQLREENVQCFVEIEKATEYPLPIILANSFVHISGSSGSVIEAAQIGVISLIFDPIGVVYYDDWIKKGMVMPAFNHQDVWGEIGRIDLKPLTEIEKSQIKSFIPLVTDLLSNSKE